MTWKPLLVDISRDLEGSRAVSTRNLSVKTVRRVQNSPTGQVLEARPGWPVLVIAMTRPD